MSPRQKKAPPRRITAFLDTNVFLHFQPFDQIPWPKELKADFVTLRVAPDVIGELNKHKDGHKVAHLKERAGKILRRIIKFALTNQGQVDDSGAVTIVCDQHRPGFDLQARGFDPAIVDDRILAAVLDYTERHRDEQVVLVTADPGAALRAHSYGVLPLELSDTMRIPPAPDEKQQRIRELEERVKSMENGLPRLGLSFVGGASECLLTVEPPTLVAGTAARAYADDQIARLNPRQTGAAYEQVEKEAQHTRMEGEVAASFIRTVGAAAGIMAVTARGKLARYHSDCMAYFSASLKYTNEMRCIKEVRLVLGNMGTVPAEDIYVCLRLPKRVDIFPQGLSIPAPVPPVPPGAPAKPAQLRGQKATPAVQHAFEYVGYQELPEHMEVRFRLPRLNHHLTEQLIGLHVRFPTPAAVASFDIEYRVSAANVPDAVEGRLNVIVNPPPRRKPRQIASRAGR